MGISFQPPLDLISPSENGMGHSQRSLRRVLQVGMVATLLWRALSCGRVQPQYLEAVRWALLGC